jgi:hypothetical protein
MKKDQLPDPAPHRVQLEKFPGKGGWTYAHTPWIVSNSGNPFGWVVVNGTIDGVVLERVKLMPRGDGTLFLPVGAALRKRLKKRAGDTVELQLEPAGLDPEVVEEVMACIRDASPRLLDVFHGLPDIAKKAYLEGIVSARDEAAQADRIIALIEVLEGRHKPR